MEKQQLNAEERLARVEESLVHIANLLENNIKSQQQVNTDLYDKLDTTNKTNWGVIWTAIGVVSAILISVGAAMYKPIDAQQTELKRRLIQVEQQERKDFEMLIRHDERLERVTDERYLKGIK